MGAATYPLSPGWKARDTAEAAASSITPQAAVLRERVLEAIRNCPGSADEIAYRLKETILSVRPQCAELFNLGLIADSGLRAANASGRKAIVWVSVP